MRFARRVADYRVHPPRCPHACRTATACVPQPTQCPRQQRASEPHTPQAVADVGLHMARHMKAASCRLLRSHAAVDGTPRRLTVPHRAPRPAAALPRQQEANFLRNGIFLAAISANRKFLRNQVLDNQRSFNTRTRPRSRRPENSPEEQKHPRVLRHAARSVTGARV